MEINGLRFVAVALVFLAAGGGVKGSCSIKELLSIRSCFSPYNQHFLDALGNNPSGLCVRARITEDVCSWFKKTVDCVKGKNLDEDTCIPTAASQTNAYLEIPCTVEDLFDACPCAPCIGAHGKYCDSNGEKTKDSPCRGTGMSATPILWMTTLMTSVLAVMWAVRSE